MRRAMPSGSRVMGVAVAAVLALGAAGGCTTGPTDADVTPTTSATASGSVQLPAPVFVTPGQTTAEASVEETIVFTQPDPANTTISTDRPDVLELTQGSDDGSAVFNPSAVARAPGVAVVTIEAPDGSTTQVTVTVR
jgi:hypothetical protein